jgi:hypothetical protein
MDWSQVVVMILFNGVFFLRLIAESSNNASKTQNLIMAIHEEMKDFHRKLCEIEKNRK